MTFRTVSTQDVDLDNREPVRFSSVGLNQDKGYLFMLSLRPIESRLDNTYFTVVAVFQTGIGQVETNLEAKFYPKGRLLMFSVPVPSAELFNNAQCFIEIEPKNRFRGPQDSGVIRVRLLFEDAVELEAKSVPV